MRRNVVCFFLATRHCEKDVRRQNFVVLNAICTVNFALVCYGYFTSFVYLSILALAVCVY